MCGQQHRFVRELAFFDFRTHLDHVQRKNALQDSSRVCVIDLHHLPVVLLYGTVKQCAGFEIILNGTGKRWPPRKKQQWLMREYAQVAQEGRSSFCKALPCCSHSGITKALLLQLLIE